MKLTGKWKKVGAVYEDKDGNRVHPMGSVKFAGHARTFFFDDIVRIKELDMVITICGGNVKRGLMLFVECYQSSGQFRNLF